MDSKAILESFAENQGWGGHSKILLLTQFINTGKPNSEFEAYLQMQADVENGVEEPDPAFGNEEDSE